MQYLIQYIIFGGGLFAAASLYYFAFYQVENSEKWQDLPYLQDYLDEHPDCKTKNGRSAKCCHCHSEKIHHKASKSNQDHHFKHYCIVCNSTLFRSSTL